MKANEAEIVNLGTYEIESMLYISHCLKKSNYDKPFKKNKV